MPLAAALLLTACSTEKAKWANVQFHNTTCHYNVWWNGNESLKQGVEKLHQSVSDDYTRLLPVERLGDEVAARGVNPEMDRAIEKGVKGIRKHSIVVKGEEHVPYIKECYLLTAYATFYKQDYVATANTCDILVNQFQGTRAADEAAVLLARCMSAEGRHAEAEVLLDQLVLNLSKGNFTPKVKDRLYQAMVEATVPQAKFKKAVEYIHLARSASSGNAVKARLTFLMAQIYQQLDMRPVAAKYYHEVLRYSPEYVMEFNAKLGEASCADLEHADLKRLQRQLDDMLADKKNTEYRDQIYYAKGEMYMGVKDAQRACHNYRLSVATARTNPAQKAKSALRLGEVLYEVYEDYDQAQRYYDTAMMLLKPDWPQYSRIKRRSDMLTELTSYTRVYERCDSLLAVASLPEAERLQLIQARIDTLVRHEQEARERALLDELKAENDAMQNTLKGDWYFYNANTVQKGKESFRKQWGLRMLEDYWFLSHRERIGVGMIPDQLPPDDENTPSDTADIATADSTATTTSGNPNDPHSVAFYLKELPTTQQQLDSIDSLTAQNLLNAGYLFYDGVGNTTRALECYLRLADDYTSHDGIVQAFYMLYRIFDRQGNTPQANYYRDMVLMGFPDSDFANLIRDAEYYKEIQRRNRAVEEAYAEVYDLYGRRRYAGVISAVGEAEEHYSSDPMMPKFRYWKALALAHRAERDSAISVLEGIVGGGSPTDTIVALAQSQLALLRSGATFASDEEASTRTRPADSTAARPTPVAQPVAATQPKEDALPEAARVFRYRENQQHYVIIIINDNHIKATELQYRLSDFNGQYYSNKGYKVNAALFTDSTQIITIHRFVSETEAMAYFRHVTHEDSPLRKYDDADHTEFVISTQNYATFYNRKDTDAYMAFFKKYYLNTRKQ